MSTRTSDVMEWAWAASYAKPLFNDAEWNWATAALVTQCEAVTAKVYRHLERGVTSMWNTYRMYRTAEDQFLDLEQALDRLGMLPNHVGRTNES